jgi:hypothetical protein
VSIKRWVGAKRALRNAAGAYSFALAALALACCREVAETQAQVLPSDAKPLCALEPGEFAGWFETGAVTLNGAVKPKDSLNFAPQTLAGERICDFHKWAEQMFLWLTSPAGNERVFQSQDFFAVAAPSGEDHKRDLLRNTSHKNDASLRDAKPPLEQGQPDTRDVLMARNGSFVYYTTYVNEIYAYFLTGTLNGGITPQPEQFPTEQEELQKIIAFGAAHGGMKITTIEDPRAKALTVTVKSAWVELTKDLDARKYITVKADIPEYNRDQLNKEWRLSGKTRPATLALVGMHVVGSASTQPRLIWATFEHVDNVPMASYSYMSTTSPDKTVDPAPNGRWLFSANSCTGRPNVAYMRAPRDAPTINAIGDHKIEPSDTCREQAWGMVPSAGNKIERNTQVIAINSSVMGMLSTDDVRKNYLLIGTTWGGGAGSNLLANTTLETYEQDQNCSDCHKGRLLDGKFHHLFMRTRPLPRQ